MYYNFKKLFNTESAQELDSLMEFVADLYNGLKDKGLSLRWTKYKDFEEYGFYIDSADKNKILFCGIWFDLWETKGIPFCLAFDWKKSVENKIKYEFEKIIQSQSDDNLSILDYQGFPTVTFDATYFDSLDDASPCLNFVIKIIEEMNFGLILIK